MLGRNWGLLLTLGLALTVSSLLWIQLRPRQPNLPAYQNEQRATQDYQPGGSACQPQVLASIRDRGQAARQRERCAEQAENHRLQSDDLVQQTRAADAAQAQADLAHQMAWMGLWGTIGGFLTLLAAGMAAFYAREAARHTDEGVRETRRIGEAQFRAYIQIQGGWLVLKRPDDPGLVDQRVRPYVTFTVKNYGQSPARWFRLTILARYYPPMHGEFRGGDHFPTETWGHDIGAGDTKVFPTDLGSAPLDDSDMENLAKDEFHIDLVAKFIWKDVFGNEIQDERVFTTYVPANGIGIKARLRPHVFSRREIEEIARLNTPENLARMQALFAKAREGADPSNEGG